MKLARFRRLVDRMVDQIPPALFKGLNGGIVVSPEARPDRRAPPGVYVLGEYVEDPYLGSLIFLYYGSFRALLAGEPAEVWEEEVWTTLLHELRHHVEARAGLEDLDREDAEELARFWAWAREEGSRPPGGGEPRPG